MNPNDKIQELQRQIKSEEAKIRNCNHEFKPPVFDPETVKEGYGSVQDGAGSDPHWSYAGYRDVQKDRWSRECAKCGYKQYTCKNEPIVTRYEPKF